MIGIGRRPRLLSKLPLMRRSSELIVKSTSAAFFLASATSLACSRASDSARRSASRRAASASRACRSASSRAFLLRAARASAFAFSSLAFASAIRRAFSLAIRSASAFLRANSAARFLAASASALRLASAAARAFWRATSSAIKRSICALRAASFFFCCAMTFWISFCFFCNPETTFFCSVCLPSKERRSLSPRDSNFFLLSRAANSSTCLALTSACFTLTSSPCER